MQKPLTPGHRRPRHRRRRSAAACSQRTRRGFRARRPADRGRRRLGARTRKRPRRRHLRPCPGSTIRWRWPSRPEHRRLRRADRRRGRLGQGRGRGRARAPASPSSPPTRRCSPSTAPSWPRWPRRRASPLNFEAAVAGGIPVIKTLREALAGNEIAARLRHPQRHLQLHPDRAWRTSGRSFADVLAEAQALGYAEADPTFDIGGFDAAHKLAILTSLAFGTRARLRRRSRSRASRRSAQADIEAADDLGYRIKLLGVAPRDRERHRAARASGHGAQALGHRRGVGRHQRVAIDGDFAATCCSSAPAPAPAPPPPRSPATSSTSRAATDPAAVRVPAAKLKPYKRAKLGAAPGRATMCGFRCSTDRAPSPHRRAHGRARTSRSRASCSAGRASALPGIGARPEAGAPALVVLITHETTEEAHPRGASKPIEQRRQGVGARRR